MDKRPLFVRLVPHFEGVVKRLKQLQGDLGTENVPLVQSPLPKGLGVNSYRQSFEAQFLRKLNYRLCIGSILHKIELQYFDT
jgi:hypothetical protein